MNIPDPRIRLSNPVVSYKDYPAFSSVTALMTRWRVSPDYAAMPMKPENREKLKAKASRGTRAHKITEDYETGNLIDVPTEMQGFLDGWVAFLNASGFASSVIEGKGVSLMHGYLGTMDRAGTLKDPYRCWNRTGDPVDVQGWTLIDIKTGVEYRHHGVQLVGYSGLLLEGHQYNRMCVYLPGDGTFTPIVYNNPTDVSAWNALMTLQNWTEK